jgi:signal transduction histidine kinase/ligand-binding sensor domain-containing protein
LYAHDYLRFTHINSTNGLSQNTINAIFKDSRGFMWFGTDDGLNRFDGKTFKIFRQRYSGTNCIGGNEITKITEDPKGHLWVGTRENGISIYYPEADSFLILNHDDHNSNSLSGNYVTDICFVKPDIMIVGYINSTIDFINIKTHNKVKHLNLLQTEPDKSIIDRLTVIQDAHGNIWVGSAYYGLFLYDKSTSGFKNIPIKAYHWKTHYKEKEPVRITDIKLLDNDHLLFSTIRTGIICFNVTDHSYKQYYLNDESHVNTADYNILVSLEKINDSIIWATTTDIGLVQYNINSKQCTYYNTSSSNNNLDFNGLLVIYKDDQGVIWVGSNGMGLYVYNSLSSFFTTISKSSVSEPRLHFKSVRTMYQSGDYLYVGGYGGIDKIDLKKNISEPVLERGVPYFFTELKEDPGYLWISFEANNYLMRLNTKTNEKEKIIPKNTSGTNHWSPYFKILPYKKSLMWIGGLRGTLLLYDFKNRKLVKSFSPETDSGFIRGNILSLYLRNNNQLWIGSLTDGILVINPETYKPIYRFANKGLKNVSYFVNPIKTIVEDSKGNIWVGTGNGLYKFIDSTTTFKGYFESDGLANNTVYGILEDSKGNLWVSTNNGISRFNPKNETFINFDKRYGLQDNEFNTNAYYKSDNGLFCFGGIKGITCFYPDKFTMDTINTKVQFTSLRINNKTAKTNLLFSKEPIPIPFGTHSLEIVFAGLNYINPYNIQYRYKINNGEWIEIGNNNKINLFSYTFGVNTIYINASNTTGKWSKYSTPIRFRFFKPYYLQIWFLILVIVLIILFTIGLFYRRTYILEKRQRLLETQISLATNDLKKTQQELVEEIARKEKIEKQLRESNATKSKIFSIIGHDLLNPFNSLLGFSELLYENINVASKEELKSYAKIMNHSSRTLFNLVQNILTWSRAQQNKIISIPEKIKLYDMVEHVFAAQYQHAFSKDISLKNNIPKDVEVFFDRNMLNTVFSNLISNAIKFSHQQSTIEMDAINKNDRVMVIVKDEGIGMDSSTVKNLFNSGYVSQTKGTHDEKGTGLGLLLVKEFVHLNGGTINIKSEKGKGTTFILILKSGKNVSD